MIWAPISVPPALMNSKPQLRIFVPIAVPDRTFSVPPLDIMVPAGDLSIEIIDADSPFTSSNTP
jgi:hypothetical protein